MARSRRGGGRGRGYGYGYAEREAPIVQPFRADFNVHTPFSADYGDLDATYLQILQTAEQRGLAMIALTDHNSVGGIAAMRREVEDLTLLEELGRLSDDDANVLAEYRRLLDVLLVLPGFEFTAAYGFPILGVFPPETSVRRLEHVLMLLGVTEAEIDSGTPQIADAVDVLTAYEVIDEHGGLVIPARADTPQGVGQSGQYGIQTQIAYTQSPLIAALDVTDLDDTSRRGSVSLYSGTRTDFPRRLHLIQTSDAHRLTRVSSRSTGEFGIGERAMEFSLPERSFAALRALFLSDDFTRERPYAAAPAAPAISANPILAAREAGETITQAFHEQARSRRSGFRPIVKDVVAFANTKGGTLYVGLSANPAAPVAGVPLVEETLRGLRDSVTRAIVPRLDVEIETEEVAGKAVIVVRVPKGPDTPYATDAGQVFVRQESETGIALRDEIVQLVQGAARAGDAAPATASERLWTAPRPAYSPDDEETDTEGDVQPEPPELPRPPQSIQPIQPPPAIRRAAPPSRLPLAPERITPAATATPAPPSPAPRPVAPAPTVSPVPAPAVAPAAPPPSTLPAPPALRTLAPERRAAHTPPVVVAPQASPAPTTAPAARAAMPPGTPAMPAPLAPAAPAAAAAPAFVAPRLPGNVPGNAGTQIGAGVPAPIGVPVAAAPPAPPARPANFVPFTRPAAPIPTPPPPVRSFQPAPVVAVPPVQEPSPAPLPPAVAPLPPEPAPAPESPAEAVDLAFAAPEDEAPAETDMLADDAYEDLATAEANRRRRPPRRRSRSRRGGAENDDDAPLAAAGDETPDTANAAEPDATPVYSLEPTPDAGAGAASPISVPPVTIEATGEEVEPSTLDTTSSETVAEPAKPRRRRRSGGRGKAAAGETPDAAATPDIADGTDTSGAASATPEPSAPAGATEEAVAGAATTGAMAFPATAAVAAPDNGAVALLDSSDARTSAAVPAPVVPSEPEAAYTPVTETPVPDATSALEAGDAAPPASGVEILATTTGDDGTHHYRLRDLKSGRELADVTRKTARGHWRQAVLAREDRMPREDAIVWQGARGYGRTVQRDGNAQYDLALRTTGGDVRIFYGVFANDLDPAWQGVIPPV